MAGEVTAATQLPFLEVPDINATGYNSIGFGRIETADGSQFQTPEVSHIITSHWEPDFAADFAQTRAVIKQVYRHGEFISDYPYKTLFEGFSLALNGFSNDPDNPTVQLVGGLEDVVRDRWEEDARERAAQINEQIEELALEPWALIGVVDREQRHTEEEVNRRWLAKVAGVEVEMAEPKATESTRNYGPVPTRVIVVEDIQGEEVKITPPMHVNDFVIKIR